MISFANPYFLGALACVAVPILIHLFTRDHIKHVAFSTMRFFAKGAKMVVQRKKFQELLLILLRAAVVALLAFIFARPFFKSKVVENPGDAVGVARVVVMDVSGSMRQAGLPEALKKEALAALDSLKQGEDEAALIAFDDAPIVQEPLAKAIDQVKTTAAAVTPGYGGTNLAEALRKANELLRGVHAKQKEIVLISDLQRQGWRYFKGDWKLGSDVKLNIRALKAGGTRAPACIVEASAPTSLVLDGQPSSIAVRIANRTEEALNNLEVTLMLNGTKADTQNVNIRANGTAAVRFRHTFDTPGDNPGSVVVGSNASSAGSVFYFNARTLPRIPVLLVNGRPSANPQQDAAFFIGKALAPTEEAPFAVKTLAADKLTSKDVAAANVVILANAGVIPAGVSDALSTLMQRGGGVIFLPGDQVKADVFNATFSHIAPCKLSKIRDAVPANGETAESLTRVDFEHPIFQTFSLPHHGDMGRPKFAKYWETTDTQLSRVLARFSDGRPAILEREMGKGIAMALVSAVDSNWNDLAYQSVFLPYLHQTVRYLAVRSAERTAFASGDPLPLPEGDTLKGPDGKMHPATDAAAAQPGFYYAMAPAGKTDICYAVNSSFTENDPANVAADEIVAAIERAPGEVLGGLDLDPATVAAQAQGKKDNGLWWVLLCGLLVLTLAELVVGNKTLRH